MQYFPLEGVVQSRQKESFSLAQNLKLSFVHVLDTATKYCLDFVLWNKYYKEANVSGSLLTYISYKFHHHCNCVNVNGKFPRTFLRICFKLAYLLHTALIKKKTMKIQKKSFLLPSPSSPEWGRSNGGNLWHFPSRNAFRYPSSPSYYVQSAKIYLLNVQNLSFVRYLTKISMFVTFVLKEPLPPLPNVFLQVSWAQHLVWGLVLLLWSHLIVR